MLPLWQGAKAAIAAVAAEHTTVISVAGASVALGAIWLLWVKSCVAMSLRCWGNDKGSG